ncbi:response regulator transcription factor [Aliiglaciecola litoralis]|uniref:Response regulator transcription factor n=1 Tax=Aliiglaciecola litoralis TaxID=582857 RepID=A0ABP3X0W3_9ALTE
MINPSTTSDFDPVVHIVDDDEAVLDSLKTLLNSLNINNATYSNGQEFLDAIAATEIHTLTGCVVMDVRMPGISGIECQQALKDLGCNLPIIFVTGHGDVPMAVQAIKEGAIEFIQKPYREQELIDCIQSAIQQNIQSQQNILYAREVALRIHSLTSREQEVMRRVISGQANKTIATELHLSQRTIDIHRANVMEKMQATSLADLVTMVLTQD